VTRVSMTMSKVVCCLVLVSSITFSGCSSSRSGSGETKSQLSKAGVGAAAGAAIGAGVGAIIGSTSGDAGAGVAIGAVAGAVAGGAIGSSL
jgi:uncharacterized membrane protein YebE (DUF533 family)